MKKRHETISSSIRIAKLKHKALWLHGEKCLSCGIGNNLELDHIKAVSIYPLLQHKFSNVQILCKECNLSKMVRTLDFRLDTNKVERFSKEDLEKLNTKYSRYVRENPVKYRSYLRKKLKHK